jgi:UDP-N-acetylmuramate dehydrogenase
MKFFTDHNITDYNTFHIDVKASCVIIIEKEDEFALLPGKLSESPTPHLVMGSGSNLLFCGDYGGTLIKVETKGITVKELSDESVVLSVAAGEEWEDVIDYCLANNYGGLENLTLIPGQAGSAAVQNIGAYGVEVGDLIECVEAVNIKTGEVTTFGAGECGFGYRKSVFKTTYTGKFIIKRVDFRLSLNPKVNTTYGAISGRLKEKEISDPGIVGVAEIIREIRRSKLPDTDEVGCAGSFFKNPVVSHRKYEFLKDLYPAIPGYLLENGEVKLAAGWMIEKAGWKGFRRGDAGVYPLQALVLVNYGNASGSEIYQLSEEIRNDVMEKFGVTLEREVQVIGLEYK